MKVRRTGIGVLGPRVRVRPWSFDPTVLHVSLADQAVVPTTDEVHRWVGALADGPARVVRTGALFPEAARRFEAGGFTAIDRLALLRADLAAVRPGRSTTVALRARRLVDASAVDRAAFGDPWANEAGDLADIRRATPIARARARLDGADRSGRRHLVAFAISGAAAGQGYVQRLAVLPEHQRRGHGRALVVDSLAWMASRRLSHALVNTAVDNAPALQLYESLGFRRLPDELVVMELRLDDR